jgi:hypothetical protein
LQEQPKARRVTAHLLSGSAAESEIMTFDYSLPAELYLAKRGGGQRQRRQHRRFTTAAEAIRFAVEDFPPVRTLNAWMQVGDECFDSSGIQRLYESRGYPGAAEHFEVQLPSE